MTSTTLDTRPHYIVVENVPGYMPESENGYHRTLADARSDALARVEEAREGGYYVRGNARDGFWHAYRSKGDREPFDLGLNISIERGTCSAAGGFCDYCEGEEEGF